ncbi:MAG TPA: cyclic nucleotide-binding domain-containing protein [Terriglobia bacterium]|nr:cyclic nucleotide-binding domain-containing protein [Terriglobia bacterium]
MRSDGPSSTVRYKDLFSFSAPAAGAAEAFDALQARTLYPAGATLFVEDELASGIFILHAGSVKLAESLTDAKSLGSRIAWPGEILGLPAALTACPYRAAAQTLEPSEIGFVDREKFSSFLCEYGVVGFRLVQLLSTALTTALDQVRVALMRSSLKI